MTSVAMKLPPCTGGWPGIREVLSCVVSCHCHQRRRTTCCLHVLILDHRPCACIEIILISDGDGSASLFIWSRIQRMVHVLASFSVDRLNPAFVSHGWT